jgi:hypothetical protein
LIDGGVKPLWRDSPSPMPAGRFFLLVLIGLALSLPDMVHVPLQREAYSVVS